MGKFGGRDVLLQLLKAYQEEACLYDRLAKAVTEQHRLLQNGRDPKLLRDLVDEQREISETIGRIDAGIAPLRSYWEQIRDGAHGTRVRALADLLDGLLEELAERIHAIVTVEKENSRELLHVSPEHRTS